MRDRDDPPKAGEKPEALLQDYLDGLLGLGDFDATTVSDRQDLYVDNASINRHEMPYPAERRAGDRPLDNVISRPASIPNNVLPLQRFAETRPLALTLPLPKLKPVEVLAKVEAKVELAPIVVEEIAPIDIPVSASVEVVEALEPQAETLEEVLEAVDELPEQQGFQPREWLDNGRPDWAQGRFECLMFSVGGLSLAVPLVELGNISPLHDELTPLFGQIDWFMGLLLTRTGKLRTVDTAKIVMPERYHEGLRENYRFVISIANMDWGLAVDHVSTAISLLPEDVKWRSQRSKRPWLAGTLVSQMCAVLDVQQLAYLMYQAENPSR